MDDDKHETRVKLLFMFLTGIVFRDIWEESKREGKKERHGK